MSRGVSRKAGKGEPAATGRVATRGRKPHSPSMDKGAGFDALQSRAGNRAVSNLLPSSGAGQPLDLATRSHMEQRFGADFSAVRVHTDAGARQSAEALDAKAYTVGRDITFSEGRYEPRTGEGRRLLAHELAHVVQQSRGGAAPRADSPNPALESAADAAAAQTTSGNGPVSVAGASGVGVACQEEDKKKRAPPGLLPPALEAKIKEMGATPQSGDEQPVVGLDDNPEMRKAAKQFLGKGKAAPADADPFGLFGDKPPAPPSWDFGADKPSTRDTLGSQGMWTPFQGWPQAPKKSDAAEAKPKPAQKKSDPAPKKTLSPEEFGAPAWPDWSPGNLSDNVLYAKRYEVAQWLGRQKSTSALTMKYAKLYQDLQYEARERDARRALDGGPGSKPEDADPEMRYLEGEIKPLLDALPGKEGDSGAVGFGPAEQRFAPASEDPDAGMQRIVIPDEFDGSDVRAKPRYIDNFRWIANDIGGNPNYILTFEDGSTVSIPKALVGRMKEQKGSIGAVKIYSDCMPGKFPNDIWVFPPGDKKDAPASKADPIQMPTSWSKAEVPRLLEEIEKHKDELETDENLHYVGREMITYEHVPESETIGKIMFWMSVAGMTVGLARSSGLLNKRAFGGLEPPPPPRGKLSFDAFEEFPGYVAPRPGNTNHGFSPEEIESLLKGGPLPKGKSSAIPFNAPEGFGEHLPVGNDNVFPPSEPWAMPKTGTDDFFLPAPRNNDPPLLQVVPKPEENAFEFPFGPTVGSSGARRAPLPPTFGTPEPTLKNSTWSAPPITGNEAADKFEQAQRVRGKRSLYVWTGRRTSIDTAEHIEFDDYRLEDSMLVDAKARTGKAGSIYDVREPNATADKPGFRREIVRNKVFRQELARQRCGAKGVVWIVQDPEIAQVLREFFAKEGYKTFTVEAPR